LVKLFEKMYMNSNVLVKEHTERVDALDALEALFPLINAAIDESLSATPIWNSRPAETRFVHWVQQTQTFITDE